jgi:hypothetical protein
LEFVIYVTLISRPFDIYVTFISTSL